MDEAYTEFLGDAAQDFLPLIREGRPVICLRTFSKIYGLAGLRCGYAITRPDIAGLLQRVREPFNVNSLAQVAATAALDDQDYVNKVREKNVKGLVQLSKGFEKLGLPYVPSRELHRRRRRSAADEGLSEFLQKLGTIVRPQPAMGDVLRVTVGTTAQNARFLQNLAAYLDSLKNAWPVNALKSYGVARIISARIPFPLGSGTARARRA